MRWSAALVLGTLLLTASTAFASPPDARTILERMKAALEPAQSSTRDIVVVTHTGGESVQWTARQARQQVANTKNILTVMLAPADVKGFALLIREDIRTRKDEQWLYLPMLRRVRKIVPVDAFESFLGTDFTTADLGFVNLRARSFRRLGEAKLGGVPAYKVEEKLQKPVYYTRIVTWVAKDSMLPLRRDFYDVGKALWKTELFDDIQTIDGIPTPLHIRMTDTQTGTSTELRESNVRYGVPLPAHIFDPDRLPDTVTQPF